MNETKRLLIDGPGITSAMMKRARRVAAEESQVLAGCFEVSVQSGRCSLCGSTLVPPSREASGGVFRVVHVLSSANFPCVLIAEQSEVVRTISIG